MNAHIDLKTMNVDQLIGATFVTKQYAGVNDKALLECVARVAALGEHMPENMLAELKAEAERRGLLITSAPRKLSANTKRAMAKYGVSVCREAFAMTHCGDGARTIAHSLRLTTQQADAAINAGRELAELAPLDTAKVLV